MITERQKQKIKSETSGFLLGFLSAIGLMVAFNVLAITLELILIMLIIGLAILFWKGIPQSLWRKYKFLRKFI